MSALGKTTVTRSRSAGARPGRLGRLAGAARSIGGRLVRGPGSGGRRRRRRGISATELRGFRKVTRLLRLVGMHPRGLGRSRRSHAA